MEALRDIRSNGIFALLKILTLGLLLVSIYNISSFSRSAEDAVDKSFSSDADLEMYSIIDSFFDADEFYEFRQSKESLNSLARFYGVLNEHPTLNFLSSFDQPIPVSDFRGGENFDVGYGTDLEIRGEYRDELTGEMVRDVKSLQMNQATYDFYNLEIDAGQAIAWDQVDYDSKTLPVLLGSNYRDLYESGDVIKANYYLEGMDLEVKGFLAEDSSIFYKGQMNTFLDDYILIPYPPKLSPVTDENMNFYGILYFAMVGGDIAVDQSTEVEELIHLISSVSQQTGFQDYAIQNVPSYLTQYRFMKDLIEQNASLVIALGVLLSAGVVLINGFLSRYQILRRTPQNSIRWLQGESRTTILSRNYWLTVLEYVVLALAVTFTISFLPNGLSSGNAGTLLATFVGLVAVLLADLLYQKRLISRHLNNQSGKEGHIL